MGDSTDLRALVPQYAGHADAAARRLSDQQVRARVGEALVDLGERLELGPLGPRVDALLLRCEFGDQHVIRAIELERFAQPDAVAAVEAADRSLIEAALRTRSAGADDLPAALTALERAFDQRQAAIIALAG